MSIVTNPSRCRETQFIPTCDICGAELPPEYDWDDAVKAKKAAGWKSRKNDDGEWEDACDECCD